MPKTATTLLEAINLVLMADGQDPVNSEDSDSAAFAKQLLEHTSTEVQTEGWGFNREPEYEVQRDSNGDYYLPKNVIEADPIPGELTNKAITLRGRRLYNATDRTFDLVVDKVTVDATVLRDWDDLPQAARSYIIAKTSRKYLDQKGQRRPSDNILRDEVTARARLMDYDAEDQDYNILDYSTLYRRSPIDRHP